MTWRLVFCACFLLCAAGCETLSGVKLGLDVMQGEAVVTMQYGPGKAVLEATQGNQRVRIIGQR